MKLKEFFEVPNEKLSVYVAILIPDLESCLFAGNRAFNKKDIEKTELANYRIVKFTVWREYFTVVVER